MTTIRRPKGIRAPRALSYAEVELIASRVRRQLAPGLELTDAFPVEDLLSAGLELDCAGRRVTLRARASRSVPKSAWATTWVSPEGDRMTVAFRANGVTLDDPRARFSACHELGHIFLHGDMLFERGSMAHAVDAPDGRLDHPHCFDTEWQANAFAAALLMPVDGLADAGPDLVTRYRVSPEAAAVRARQVAKLNGGA